MAWSTPTNPTPAYFGDYVGQAIDRFLKPRPVQQPLPLDFGGGQRGGGGGGGSVADLIGRPGVRLGPSTATVGQSDSSLNVGAGPYDPVLAGQQEGQEAGAKINAENKAKYDALLKIPGFNELKAAREVYGRSGILDLPNPSESRAAMAKYMTTGNLQDAAAALRAGAPPSMFPGPEAFNPDGSIRRPLLLGSPEHLKAVVAEDTAIAEARQAAMLKREEAYRALVNQMAPPAAVSREATGSRLALDEVRKTAPRPSEAPDADHVGPIFQQSVADSLQWDASTYQPALQRFRAANIPGATAPATAAANDRMAKYHGQFQRGELQNQVGPGEGLTETARRVAPRAVAPAAPDTAAWTQKNPPKPGETLEQYRKRASAALSAAPE